LSVLYPLFNNFSKGEISSRVNGRIDSEVYAQGCETMLNCIIMPQGGAGKRPGTVFLGEIYKPEAYPNGDPNTRLIPFEVNDDEIYVLEMGHRYIRVWDVRTGEVETPTPLISKYPSDAIKEVQYAQTEGLIYFTHQDYPVTVLEKGDSGFTCRSISFTVPDYDSSADYKAGDVVTYNGTLYRALKDGSGHTPIVSDWDHIGSMPANVTGDVTAWSSGSYSANDYVVHNEELWVCIKPATTQEPGVPVITADDLADQDWIYGGFISVTELSALGKSIDQYLTAKYGSGLYYSSAVLTSSGYNFIVTAYRYYYKIQTYTEEEYWLSLGVVFDDIPSPYTLYEWDVADTYGLNDYAYDPANHKYYRSNTASNTTALGDGGWWALESDNPLFSEEGNYPAAVSFMGERLILAGTKNKPQTIFGSKRAQHTNFGQGLDDDDSYAFTIAADRSSRIKWITAKDYLMIGTSSSEWLATGGGSDAITPTNVQVLRQSAYGSAYQQAVFVADTLLFFQKGGRKLREYMYSNDNKAYQAQDLTFLADHITQSGVIESTYQQNPDSILWSVKSNGELIGLTYDRINQIAGWHRHQTSGGFKSIVSIDGRGSEDELWMIVSRLIGGTVKYYIEKVASRESLTQINAVFCDSAVTQTAGQTLNITSITWSSDSIQVTFSGTADFSNGDYVKILNSGNVDLDNIAEEVSGLSGQTFNLAFSVDEFDEISTASMYKVTDTITGLDHLEGETVTILGDGAVFPAGVVASGSVTISTKCNVITAGKPYIMKLIPKNIELSAGSGLASRKRISAIIIKLFETLGGVVKIGEDGHEESLMVRDQSVPFGYPSPLFTGTKTIPVESNSEDEISFTILHSDPTPCTVMAVAPEMTQER